MFLDGFFIFFSVNLGFLVKLRVRPDRPDVPKDGRERHLQQMQHQHSARLTTKNGNHGSSSNRLLRWTTYGQNGHVTSPPPSTRGSASSASSATSLDHEQNQNPQIDVSMIANWTSMGISKLATSRGFIYSSYLIYLEIWRFPEMGVPLVILHFRCGCSMKS